MNEHDKFCGIVFDAMHLEENEFHNQATDLVEGREDLGEYGFSNNVANYGMIFMLKGLFKNWKQIIGFFFFMGTFKSHVLKQMIQTAVKRYRTLDFV